MNRKGVSSPEKVYEVIQSMFQTNPNKSPTLSEIARVHIPNISRVSVFHHLKTLAARGKIRIESGKARGISLVNTSLLDG